MIQTGTLSRLLHHKSVNKPAHTHIHKLNGGVVLRLICRVLRCRFGIFIENCKMNFALQREPDYTVDGQLLSKVCCFDRQQTSPFEFGSTFRLLVDVESKYMFTFPV